MKLPQPLRLRRPATTEVTLAVRLAKVEAERDELKDVVDAVAFAHSELMAENRKLRAASQLDEPAELRRLRRQAEQDRRNVLVVSDVLAIAEGRRAGVPLSSQPVAEKLLAEVRAAVAGVLATVPECFR